MGESAALARNPHKSRLVGNSECWVKPFASHLELVKYYKSEAEKLRAACMRQRRKFTSGWKVDNFDAKAAVLKIAKQKGDSWTEKTLRTRLDIERCAESFSFRKWGVEGAPRAFGKKKAPPAKRGGCPHCYWDEESKQYRRKCCRKVIDDLDPTDAAAHINLGLVLQDVRKDYEGAEMHYRKAIKLDPSDAAAHNNLGGLLQTVRNNYDGAERHYRKAIKLDPECAAAHSNLGVLLYDVRKDYVGAERHYRKAIKLDPSDAMVHSNLGAL